MTATAAITLFLPDAEATTRLGARIAPMLRPGDTLLLHGPIGAGKTHFARAVVQARLAAVGLREDVPSPTFTLVQVYQAGDVEIWHSDLFRLTHPDEVTELGLQDAFDTAICLVEWPEKLADLAPADALHLRFAAQGEGRSVSISGEAARWEPLLTALVKDLRDDA